MDRNGYATTAGGLTTGPTATMVWGRAGVLGTVALGTGAVSHATAGGNLPGLLGMTLLLGSCVLAAAWLLLRQASATKLVLMVLAGQTWVHGVLSAVSGHRGDPTALPAGTQVPVPVSGGGTLLEQYRTGVQATSRPGEDWLLHQAEHFVGQGPLMLAAHLGGAVVLGLFLAVGENALWTLLRLAAVRAGEQRRLVGLRRTARAVSRGVALRSAAVVTPAPQLPAPQVLPRSELTHRGPPYVLAA